MGDNTTDFMSILVELNSEYEYSDYKLAKETGIERSKLSKVRTGKHKTVSYDDGIAIMKIYNRCNAL